MTDVSKLQPGAQVLLQGNEALARGAVEAGVAFCAAYPGNPSSEILETLAASAQGAGLYAEWSANEKVALEAAAGASFAGLRAMASMKQNGINVAQDFICNLTISGTGPGGLLLVTADDPGSISSTNEQDARFIARLAELPLLEPATPQECLEYARLAFDLSEHCGTVVVLRGLSRLSHTRAGVTPGPLGGPKPKPHWDPAKIYKTMPVSINHPKMHQRLAAVLDKARAAGLNTYDGPDSPELLVIASGSSALYAREARATLGMGGRVGLLKLGLGWPLDGELILDHLRAAPAVLFGEEVDPLIETSVKALYADHAHDLGAKRFFGKASGHLPDMGELSPALLMRALGQIMGVEPPAVDEAWTARAAEAVQRLAPPREFGFCAGCPHRASFWAIKQALAVDGRQGLVAGDIGCYSLGSMSTGFNRVNSVHCMGSGPGISSGLGQLGRFGFDQPVVSVVGDSTFFHAALPALVNARWNGADYVLAVLDNSATAMTGFQPHPGTGDTATGQGSQVPVESVLEAFDVPYEIVDPYDLAATQKAVYQAAQGGGGVRALILRRVCALVQNKQGGHPYKMSVDAEACRGQDCGCNKFCSRVFRCPGLIFDEASGKAAIDEVVCVGCGVCAQVCPAGAIKATPKGEEAAA